MSLCASASVAHWLGRSSGSRLPGVFDASVASDNFGGVEERYVVDLLARRVEREVVRGYVSGRAIVTTQVSGWSGKGLDREWTWE